MERRELPEGWEWRRLDDITKKCETVNPNQFPETQFYYIDIDAIDNTTQRITNPKIIIGNEAPSRARQKIKRNDILFSTVRTYLKNISLVDQQYDGLVASTGFCVIRVSDEVDSKFLYYYLLDPSFLNSLEKYQRGANYPAISDADIFNQFIPLPPLPVQHRIVKILNQADALRSLRTQADAETQKLLQSVFYEMFGDPVRIENEYPVEDLKNLCLNITDGKHGDCKNSANSGYYFISAKDVIKGKIDYTNSRQITKDDYFEVNKRIQFEIGDIVITNSGSIGKVAIAEDIEKTSRTTFQKSVAIVKINKNLINSKYLASFLDFNKHKLLNQSSGSSQKNLLLRDINNFKIPLPPLSLQQKYANIIKHFEILRAKQEGSVNEISLLFDGLMSKAFIGELN